MRPLAHTAAALCRSRRASTNPMIAAHPLGGAATFSRATRLARMKPGLRSRSSGGYPVIASSGKTATSHPASSASWYAATMRSALPSRSPTTVFNWQRATRTRATWPDYRVMVGAPVVDDAERVVRNASRSLGRLLDRDETALAVLAHLDTRAPVDHTSADALVRWKSHEFLRIATRDLLGIDALEQVGAALAAMAADVFTAALELADGEGLAVVGMGKTGGRELNYASDVDVMLVAAEGSDTAVVERRARAAVDIARRCFRVDLNLRPEGRNGALVRTLTSYEAYWDQWAEPWEFQALLKARALAGDPELCAAFDVSAADHLWARPFTAESIRSVRAMKVRTEADVARRGLSERELKLGPGGIRDVEFAVQLLQLVHGRADEELRTPTTLDALAELADAGYVARRDSEQLADAYRYLRTVEHRLQLEDEQQVHAIPQAAREQDRLARVLGYNGSAQASATELF